MINIDIQVHFKSALPLTLVQDKINEALTALCTVHEADEPSIATVSVSEEVITLQPVLEGTFYTDTLSVR